MNTPAKASCGPQYNPKVAPASGTEPSVFHLRPSFPSLRPRLPVVTWGAVLLVALGSPLLAGPADAQPAPVSRPPATPPRLELPSVETIVARNLEARGGLDRLRAVRAVRLEGEITLPDGQVAPTTILMKRPSLIRQEVRLQGERLVQAFDGRQGWALNPRLGTTPIEVPPDVAARMAEQADFDGPLVDWKTKGHRLEVLGVEQADGRQVVRLRVERRSGEPQDLLIDLELGLEVRSEAVVDEDGRRVRLETRYSDFRSVDGITLPFVVELFADGRLQQRIALTRVAFPDTLDDNLFRLGR